MVKLNEQEKRQKKQEENKKEVIEEKIIKENLKVKQPVKNNLSLEDLDVVLYPLVTEKAVNMIDTENKLTFIVADKATKKDVKKIIEKAYSIKIEKINIVRDMKGRKKAVIKLKKEFKAQDLATKLGVL
ncbi:MAG: 50S ribosomal protein L23 [Candidatus ainarchaeum sp.]|nr:50S ribosomal protein L23 [Candidatus ainarchaeum sp.]